LAENYRYRQIIIGTSTGPFYTIDCTFDCSEEEVVQLADKCIALQYYQAR
jgi:hypothetical protein